MGLNLWGNCSSSPYAVENSNPDPLNFKIESEYRVGRILILKVNYPNCKNFEGDKILVYEGVIGSSDLLKNLDNKLDPHFEKDKISPIARFEPTDKGMEMAFCFALWYKKYRP